MAEVEAVAVLVWAALGPEAVHSRNLLLVGVEEGAVVALSLEVLFQRAPVMLAARCCQFQENGRVCCQNIPTCH